MADVLVIHSFWYHKTPFDQLSIVNVNMDKYKASILFFTETWPFFNILVSSIQTCPMVYSTCHTNIMASIVVGEWLMFDSLLGLGITDGMILGTCWWHFNWYKEWHYAWWTGWYFAGREWCHGEVTLFRSMATFGTFVPVGVSTLSALGPKNSAGEFPWRPSAMTPSLTMSAKLSVQRTNARTKQQHICMLGDIGALLSFIVLLICEWNRIDGWRDEYAVPPYHVRTSVGDSYKTTL